MYLSELRVVTRVDINMAFTGAVETTEDTTAKKRISVQEKLENFVRRLTVEQGHELLSAMMAVRKPGTPP